MGKPDPLAAALDAVAEPTNGGTTSRVEFLFGNRPDVLASIERARRDRKLSYRQIAKVLSADGASISEGAIQGWLNKRGIN